MAPQVPTTLGELLLTVGELHAAGEKNVLSWVRKVARQRGLRVRNDSGRVLLSPEVGTISSEFPITRETMGVILDTRTWKLLALPPAGFCLQPQDEDIAEGLTAGDYTIYENRDTTMVTIYHWNDQWCVSSTNGYEVSGYQWIGSKTYAEILHELLSPQADLLGLRLTEKKRLEFDRLDPAYSYTIQFHHPDFHPVQGEPAGVWNMRRVRLDPPEVEPDEGLPGFPALAQVAQPVDLAELRGRCARGLEDRSYGYSLRSKTGAHPDVNLESTLQVFLRKEMYRQPYYAKDKAQITPENRLAYNVIRALLSPNSEVGETLLRLCPQFQDLYARLSSTIKNLTHQVKMLRLRRLRSPTTTVRPGQRGETPFRRATERICVQVEAHLNQADAGPAIDLLIKDQVCSQTNVVLFMELLNVF